MRFLGLLWLAFILVGLQSCTGFVANSADRRSPGTLLEDESIETKAMAVIKEKFKDTAQVNVTSYNRFVLITGEAVSDEAKTGIERVVYSVLNVKKIADEVTVGALSNAGTRRTDASITHDINSALSKKPLTSGSVKVTTSKGIVFLLGLVTHADANAASEIASTTGGVQKVVRVFEYID